VTVLRGARVRHQNLLTAWDIAGLCHCVQQLGLGRRGPKGPPTLVLSSTHAFMPLGWFLPLGQGPGGPGVPAVHTMWWSTIHGAAKKASRRWPLGQVTRVRWWPSAVMLIPGTVSEPEVVGLGFGSCLKPCSPLLPLCTGNQVVIPV
jgi:hypothetical protein